MPAANEKRLPLTRPSEIRRDRPAASASATWLGGRDGISRQPERAREHARAAAGQEADRDVRVEPVQGLVEAAVPREDDDRVDAAAARPGHELRRMARALGEEEVELGDSLQLRADVREPLLAHAGRERIDDERDSHGVA